MTPINTSPTQSTRPPTVGIVVPVFNVERYLKEALDSFLEQTHPHVRVYAVDDGSTDASGRILDAYAAKDKRVVTIHKRNGGVSSARNAGLDRLESEAAVDFVCFIDSDDRLDPRHCASFVKAMLETNADYGVCAYRTFTRWGARDPRTSQQAVGRVLTPQGIAEQYFHVSVDDPGRLLPKDTTVSLFHANRFYRASLIRGMRFDETLTNCEDQDFLIRAFPKMQKGVVVPEALFYYRKRASSLSNAHQSKHMDFVVFERFYQNRFEFPECFRIGIQNDFVHYVYQELFGLLTELPCPRERRSAYERVLELVRSFDFPVTPIAQKKIDRIRRGYRFCYWYAHGRRLLQRLRNRLRRVRFFP